MITTSSQYKTAITDTAREWVARITLTRGEDTLQLDHDDLGLTSLTITEKAMPSDEFTVGGVVSNTLDLKLLTDSVGTFSLDKAEIFIEYGINTGNYDEPTYEYIPMGFFDVDEAISRATFTEIKGFDALVRLDRDYDSNLTYPATLIQIFQDICSKNNITTDVVTFPNADLIVPEKPSRQTYRGMLSDIMELAGSFAHMGRNGKLQVKWFIDTDLDITPDNRISFDPKSELVQITGVKYEQGDLKVISGTDVYPIDISGNVLLTYDHQIALDKVLARVNSIIMKPNRGEWIGDPSLEVGDLVTNVDKDGVEYPTPLTSLTHRFRGNSSFEATAKSQTTQKATPYSETITSRVRHEVATITADQNEKLEEHSTLIEQTSQSITSVAQSQTTLETEVGQSITTLQSQITQNSGEISSRVKYTEMGDAISGATVNLATIAYVDGAIDGINRANPNLVSNRSDRWEQGNLTSGAMVTSTKHIRTQAYFPVRAGNVTIKVNPLYQAAIVVYDQNYGYVSTTSFATEQTINIPTNSFFKAILRKVGGTEDIIPSAIDTAELKVENASEASQWTPYFGDLSLEEQKEFFTVVLTSSNGWTVDTNVFSTQLRATLFLFNEDVTSRYPSNITWYRQYPGSEKEPIGSGTTFNVTPSMTEKSATYEVVFNIPANFYYLTTKSGDQLLTKGGDFLLAKVSDDPGLSVKTDKVLVRDYRDKILSTESSITQLAGSIEQKVEQSAYNADKNQIETSVTTLTTKVGGVEASINGTTHTFTATSYVLKDANGRVIMDNAMGMANEQNITKHDDCENGYPLSIPLHIGANTASIYQALVKWKNSPFRATAKSAASGGGTKTSASGGGTTSGASSATTTASGGGATSGASSATTTSSGGSASVTSASGGGHTSGGGGETTRSSTVYAGAAKTTSAQYGHSTDHYHSYRDDNHSHNVYVPSHSHWVNNHTHSITIPAHSHKMPHTHSIPSHTHSMKHTHSNPNHSHTIDLTHSHNLVFGVVQQNVSSNALTIWVDGVQRGSVNASQGEVDITPYLQTTGWHTVELRTTTLKRIDANIFIKSYIRR